MDKQSWHYLLLQDRKSTRLNSSHLVISYAVFCLGRKSWSTETTSPRETEKRLLGRCSSPVPGPTTAKGIRLNCCCFFNDTATTEIYTLSLHDALPIYKIRKKGLSGPSRSGRTRGSTARCASGLRRQLCARWGPNWCRRLACDRKHRPRWRVP